MRIYLVQHGQAKAKADDPERQLTLQGREDISRVAGFLSLFEKPKPQRIIHSGKLRSKQTAEMFAQAWQIDNVENDPDLSPNAMPELWRDKVLSQDEDLMLVGHLPHLSMLASLLIQGDAAKETLHFRYGGCVCLEQTDAGFVVAWQVNPTLFYA